MSAGISLSFVLIAVTDATLSICFALAQSHHDLQAATRDLEHQVEEPKYELASHRQ